MRDRVGRACPIALAGGTEQARKEGIRQLGAGAGKEQRCQARRRVNLEPALVTKGLTSMYLDKLRGRGSRNTWHEQTQGCGAEDLAEGDLVGDRIDHWFRSLADAGAALRLLLLDPPIAAQCREAEKGGVGGARKHLNGKTPGVSLAALTQQGGGNQHDQGEHHFESQGTHLCLFLWRE